MTLSNVRNHVNYTVHNGTDNPLDIEGNYWTNGPADYNQKAVLIANNHNITSSSQIPAAIVAAGGLETHYLPLLSWQPAL